MSLHLVGGQWQTVDEFWARKELWLIGTSFLHRQAVGMVVLDKVHDLPANRLVARACT
jgi:hypothetical protein